jgi:ABC-type transport system substrate-binding protein
VKNKQTAFMQFAAGSYDFFNGLEGSFKDELLTDQAMLKPKYAQKMKAIITPFLNTEYVGCYLGEYPGKTNWLKDVHLRRALFYAVDKQKLVRFFRNGLGDAGDWGVVPPILNAHEINHLILCGISTNLAVEGTARDAHDRNYSVTIVKDACSANSEENQEKSISILSMITEIQTVDEISKN